MAAHTGCMVQGETLCHCADGVLNSLFSALAGPGISFVIPPLAFNIYYWKRERREACPKQIPR